MQALPLASSRMSDRLTLRTAAIGLCIWAAGAFAWAAAPAGAQQAVSPSKEASPPVAAIKTPALKTAAAKYLAAKAGANKNLFTTWDEFVTPGGEDFVSVSLYVPKAAGLTGGSELTFFGMIADAARKPVAAFEEAGRLAETAGDFHYDKSFALPAGKFRAVFGIAKDGKPVSLAGASLNVTGLDKSAAGVSRLILTNNIYMQQQPPRPTDPFAFGSIGVVPKGDRAFRKAEDVLFFVELRNFGVDPIRHFPRVQMSLDVVQTTTAKKPFKRSAPLVDAVVMPLRGMEGHYNIGSGIPLSGFPPGDYAIQMKVIDAVAQKTYDLMGSFHVLADPSPAVRK
jgi:hypothetical protein